MRHLRFSDDLYRIGPSPHVVIVRGGDVLHHVLSASASMAYKAGRPRNWHLTVYTIGDDSLQG